MAGKNRCHYGPLLERGLDCELLSKSEECELAMRSREGDASARGKLITSHLKLVSSVASRYAGAHPGKDFQDLFQSGVVGLTKAVDRFDPNRGARLSTYALYWIREEIHIQLGEIQFPVKAPMGAVRVKLLGGGGKKQEPDGTITYFPLEVVVCLDAPKRFRGDGDIVAEVARKDLLHDTRPNPEESVLAEDLADKSATALQEALTNLNERERLVVSGRLLGEKRESLDNLGQALGVSKERVRQIEGRALGKMKKFIRECYPDLELC